MPDCFICFAWHGPVEHSLIVAVNFAPNQSQSYVQIPFDEIRSRAVRFQDLMSPAAYDRSGDELLTQGWGQSCREFFFKGLVPMPGPSKSSSPMISPSSLVVATS